MTGYLLEDEESERLWAGRSGIALEGELQGTQLRREESMLAFWFG